MLKTGGRQPKATALRICWAQAIAPEWWAHGPPTGPRREGKGVQIRAALGEKGAMDTARRCAQKLRAREADTSAVQWTQQLCYLYCSHQEPWVGSNRPTMVMSESSSSRSQGRGPKINSTQDWITERMKEKWLKATPAIFMQDVPLDSWLRRGEMRHQDLDVDSQETQDLSY